MTEAAWTVEFYIDGEGREPAKKWLEGLSEVKRDAAIAALTTVLARLGTAVCDTEWGKNLGGGLYELRIRHSAEETKAMFADQPRGPRRQEVLLRVFFAVHGRRVVLLLGGYDKGRSPSERRQRQEIAAARERLADFKARRSRKSPSQ